MKEKRLFLYLSGGALIIFFVVTLAVFLVGRNYTEKSKNQIAIIKVNGTISGGKTGGSFFGELETGSENIMEQIRIAGGDSSIKGLLLYINSPGGSSSASEAIYREVRRFREKTGKPVLAVMEEVAASGGYYIALAADEIFANPSTITGSIGVIMQFTSLEGLYEKYGVELKTIKSGKYKDMGNPSREMTEEERRLLQQMVDEIYQQFVDVVAERRGLKREEVLKLAKGQIFTGTQAKKLGLIDHLGNFYDGVEYLARKAKIKGNPVLVYYDKPSFLERVLGKVVNSFFAVMIGNLEIPYGNFNEKSLYQPGINNIEIRY